MGRKRIILTFSFISLLIIALLMGGIWYLASNRGPEWGQRLLGTILSLATFALAFGALFLILLAVALLAGKGAPLESLAAGIIGRFFPLSLSLARIFGIDADEVRASFLQVHNELTRRQKTKIPPEQLLVLGPICLQKADCKYKISREVDNCRRCGACPVADLLALRDKYGFQLAIVTGGTRARQLIKDLRPQGVIAIACERDLTSGIQDSRPLRVIGITNQRPHGPCYETLVDIPQLEQAIRELIELK